VLTKEEETMFIQRAAENPGLFEDIANFLNEWDGKTYFVK
jgi:hypothetical protein